MRRFFKGFVYAAKGIALCVQKERNFRFHLCVAAAVVFFALRYYSFDEVRWAVLFLTVFGVLALEAVNTAVERAVGLPDEAHDALAGQAKDLAAGAVLLFSIGAVCVGAALFWQVDVFRSILADWIQYPLIPVLLAVYAAAAAIFVFKKREE
jgi:diacylglycerol kinase